MTVEVIQGEVIERRTPEQWATVIRADLARAVEGIIAAGLHLIEAKQQFPHGEWLPWVERELPIKPRTAQQLMEIAGHTVLANTRHVTHLPSHWSTLYELAQLDPPWLERAIERGEVHPELERRQARELVISYKQLAAEVAFDVRHGDFREQFADLSGVDAIITDPPYAAEHLPLYEALAEHAARWLKPGGVCAVMTGQSWLPDVFSAMAGKLDYHWTLAYLTPGGQAVQLFQRKVNTFWKPILLYTNGTPDLEWFGDVARSDVNDNDKRHHHWGQSESGMADLIKRLTRAGQRICDPFMGAGTTGVAAISLGRSFVGCDVNADHVQTADERLQEAVYDRL